MSDKIKVGDMVHPDGYGDNVTQRVAAVEGDEAWLVNSKGDHLTHRLSKLTRIEPEKVAPKYAVGQSVRLKNDALDFPGEVGQVIHLGYYVSRAGYWGVWVAESKLEPVPEQEITA